MPLSDNCLILHPLTYLINYIGKMKVIRKVSELQSVMDSLRSQGLSIGLVPTMGALHKGHLSLMERARGENDVVVASVFVNPTQFSNQKTF